MGLVINNLVYVGQLGHPGHLEEVGYYYVTYIEFVIV